MPRPKRATRAVASRKATGANTAPQPPADPTSDIYDLSDREKERISRRKSGVDLDAEGLEDEARRPAQLVVEAETQDVRAVAESILMGDPTMTQLDHVTTTSKTVGASSGVDSPPEIGRRSETRTGGARLTDVSGLDLDDEMFGDLDDSIVIGEDSQTAQHSNETSSLNVAAFRRRPRVSSIVGKDDAPIRPSSRGPNTPGITSTFSFGNFKRRKREPSILGARHRSVSRQPGGRDESADEGDFTVLGDDVRGSSAVPSRAASREPSPRRQTRKRKSLEDHNGGEKRVAVEPEEEMHNSIEIDQDDDHTEPLSSPPSTPAGSLPDPNDPDLAPPESIASSQDSPIVRVNLDALTHRNHHSRRAASRAHKTPELDADASDISSPPSLTHSPNYDTPPPKAAARGRAKKRDPPPKVTTADLASLLPRRRHKQVEASSDAEEDTLTLDNDDDELSYAQPKRTRKTARPLGNASNSTAKGKQPARKGGKRTYGSRVSDKENEGLEDSIEVDGDEEAAEGEEVIPDDETSQVMLERLGEELEDAAKKFKEVDKWELEFEEVTEPSSPGNAR